MNHQYSRWSFRGRSAPRNFARNVKPPSRNITSGTNEQIVSQQSYKDPNIKKNVSKETHLSDETSSIKILNSPLSEEISELQKEFPKNSKNESINTQVRAPIVQQIDSNKKATIPVVVENSTDNENMNKNIVSSIINDNLLKKDMDKITNLSDPKPLDLLACVSLNLKATDNRSKYKFSSNSSKQFDQITPTNQIDPSVQKNDFIEPKPIVGGNSTVDNYSSSDSTEKSQRKLKISIDPPFQSHLMEKSGIPTVQKHKISFPYRDVPFESYKKKNYGKWNKSDKPFKKSETVINPMEFDYDDDPKIDRSILDYEPEIKVKKFSNKCRIFVGGLLNANEKLLKDMFTKFGEISELWLNKEKGFGFVKLDYESNVQRAIDHYNGMVRINNVIRVRHAARSSSIKVSNLSFAISNEHLCDSFKIFGEVDHAVVVCDERGKSLGWGIVDFVTKKSALSAVARCNEEFFLLCKSPIPIFVSELKEEDIEEGFPEKTAPKNSLFHRERSEGPRFAMHGSFEYQHCLKWKVLFANEKTERKKLDDLLKKNRLHLEIETEKQFIDFLQQQERLRHQEELRRIEETKRHEDVRKQDQLRHQELIKNESIRQNMNMRMQEDERKLEEFHSYEKYGNAEEKFIAAGYGSNLNFTEASIRYEDTKFRSNNAMPSLLDYKTNLKQYNINRDDENYIGFGDPSPNRYSYDDIYENFPSKTKINSTLHQTCFRSNDAITHHLNQVSSNNSNFNSPGSTSFRYFSDPSGYGLDYRHYNNNRSSIEDNYYTSIQHQSNSFPGSKQIDSKFSKNHSMTNLDIDAINADQTYITKTFISRQLPEISTAYDRRRSYLNEWSFDQSNLMDKRRKI